MRKLFCSLFILLLFATGYGSIDRIIKLDLFNVEPIDSLEDNQKKYVLNKIDSLSTVECVVPFLPQQEILEKYRLADLPCIQLYSIEDGRDCLGRSYHDIYERFLFNSCDSTIYPFGGGHVRFSKFIKDYLPIIISNGEDALKELIYLYLNTLEREVRYYIITSKDDFEDIWRDSWVSRSIAFKMCSEQDKQEEIDEVGNLNYSLLFFLDKKDHYYEMSFTTWENRNGSIKRWSIKISENVFEVYDSIILLNEMGPCSAKP